MGFFKRNKKSDESRQISSHGELAAVWSQGEEMIGMLAEAHMSWGLGSADRWGLDQRTGVITWTFPGRTATAAAQLLGSYNADAGTWLWAWGNQSILPEMSRDSAVVRDWLLAQGYSGLAEPMIDADDQMAAMLAAIAVRVTAAPGFYRGTGSAAIPFITFGPVTLTAEDGTSSTFQIDFEVESAAE
ncbi:DUF6882 domain-containing protein [Nocardia sp. NPDC059764]|uniref:DUF6882 domain-containing protein n=1 Tax=Nocardia sp. NPDC059764 TaxID=3346939 RepID=UPI003654545E